MTDLRTTQILAYLTYQPERYREVLGLPAQDWPRQEGRLSLWLRHAGGWLLTRIGQWMLARAAVLDEVPAVSPRHKTA